MISLLLSAGTWFTSKTKILGFYSRAPSWEVILAATAFVPAWKLLKAAAKTPALQAKSVKNLFWGHPNGSLTLYVLES
jgi:hypothetical protein